LVRRMSASARSKPSALGNFIVLRSGAFGEFCFEPKHRLVRARELEVHRVCEFGTSQRTGHAVTALNQMGSLEAPLEEVRLVDFQPTYHEQVSGLKPHEGMEQRNRTLV
jgi:hypothetical protein